MPSGTQFRAFDALSRSGRDYAWARPPSRPVQAGRPAGTGFVRGERPYGSRAACSVGFARLMAAPGDATCMVVAVPW